MSEPSGPAHQAAAADSGSILHVLASEGVHRLISSTEQVPLSSCGGKSICILFSANWCRPCRTFVPLLVNLYETINAARKELEIIFVSFDQDMAGFNEHFKCMPWLAVPFNVSLQRRLSEHYRVSQIPSLIPLTSQEIPGHDELIGFIEDFGAEAFPFTRKRMEELKLCDKARREGGNLEQLLAREGRDYVASSRGGRVLVADLIGKTIGLYFGARWSPPCSDFTIQLIEAYKELKGSGDQCFEVVFISSDRDKAEFDLDVSSMPWLCIPYEDRMRKDLCRIFNIRKIPALVIVGPDGKTVTADGRDMVSLYGARVFPFTESRMREVEVALRKEGEKLPPQVKDVKHEHVLKPEMTRAYICDSCKRPGRFWALSCGECNYDLHPTCLDVGETTKSKTPQDRDWKI